MTPQREVSPRLQRLQDEMLAAGEASRAASRRCEVNRARTDSYQAQARDCAEVIAHHLAEQGPREQYDVRQDDVFSYCAKIELRDKSASYQPDLDAEAERLSRAAVDAVHAWSPVMLEEQHGVSREDAERLSREAMSS